MPVREVVGQRWFSYGHCSASAGEPFCISCRDMVTGGIMDRWAKHKIGKSCLYINKLADVDLDVIEELVARRSC
jgi:hypothetical protein